MFESAAVQVDRLQLISDGGFNTKVFNNIKILAIREATTKTLVDKLMQLIQVIITIYPEHFVLSHFHLV